MEATCTSRSEGIAMPLKKKKFFVAKFFEQNIGFPLQIKVYVNVHSFWRKIKENETDSESTYMTIKQSAHIIFRKYVVIRVQCIVGVCTL
jgi:hypothetical protein